MEYINLKGVDRSTYKWKKGSWGMSRAAARTGNFKRKRIINIIK